MKVPSYTWASLGSCQVHADLAMRPLASPTGSQPGGAGQRSPGSCATSYPMENGLSNQHSCCLHSRRGGKSCRLPTGLLCPWWVHVAAADARGKSHSLLSLEATYGPLDQGPQDASQPRDG